MHRSKMIHSALALMVLVGAAGNCSPPRGARKADVTVVQSTVASDEELVPVERQEPSAPDRPAWMPETTWQPDDAPCPEGAQAVGTPPPDGRGVSCQLRGARHGPGMEWHLSGYPKSIYTWREGVLEGPYATWHDGGALESSGTYLRGALHGTQKYWHPNRRLAETHEMCRGAPCGASKRWYESGQPRSHRTYERSGRHGVWLSWFENGALRSKKTYRQGQREGRWEYHHPNGGLARVEHYDAGKAEGVWSAWDSAGKPSEPSVRWRQGRVVAIEAGAPLTKGAP